MKKKYQQEIILSIQDIIFNVQDEKKYQQEIILSVHSSRHDLKSIGTGNLYLGPLHIIDRILESVIIFKSPVTI